MTLAYAVRYFQVVAVVPPLFVAGFVVTVAAALARLTHDPSSAVEAMTPVLLLQLFVASSGFRTPARRGYYDLLLTSGTPRWQIAVAHCLVSVGPGIVSWLCVGLGELAASHGKSAVSFTAGTCVAMLGASLVAWGSAVFSSRPAAAVGWLLVMTIPSLARVISPVRLLGAGAAGPGRHDALVLGTAALVLLAAGSVSIVRAPTPLEGTQ